MQPFEVVEARDVAQAIELGRTAGATYLAGGTNVVDFMRAGSMEASTLIDIDWLPLRSIDFDGKGLRVGALTRMSDVAADPMVRSHYRFVAESLELSASAQLRNMASIGGNLLQRTRCPYFRDRDFKCNKRVPGSGCAAREGENRRHAILGGSEACVATHASDLAVALVAAEAEVHLQGPDGEWVCPLETFYLEPGATPQIETRVGPGDLILAVAVPPLPGGEHSVYLKLRERASYEFALVSVAASVALDGRLIKQARIALGGVATRPWRAREVEEGLQGVAIDDLAAISEVAGSAFVDAQRLRDNAFKVELGKRAIVAAVRQAGGHV
ncbi:MAG: FAD binding domain-containing protein [Solirubrobacterales bacterium]|nr:FAD binding domain-containing protein [Solirubrobacterales bacterium]